MDPGGAVDRWLALRNQRASATDTFSDPAVRHAGLHPVGDAGSDALPQITDQMLWGGTVMINGIKMIVPCNTILQMPAATLTWAQLFPYSTRTAQSSPRTPRRKARRRWG